MIGQMYGHVKVVDEMLIERTFGKENRAIFFVTADFVKFNLTIAVDAEKKNEYEKITSIVLI